MVVVGYGTQRKVDLTGAVASVTRKDFVNKPFTSPDQILNGRVSGVNIANRSGDPGAPIDVRIRGVGTTGTNQPLWVIDGVPIVQTSNITVNTGSSTESNPLAGINTSDIESIDVLKDASASAIYGARAANGVIIVTTRRGKEGKTSLTYDGFYGTQSVPKNRQFDLLNVAEYVALQSELGRDFSAFSSKPFVIGSISFFKKGLSIAITSQSVADHRNAEAVIKKGRTAHAMNVINGQIRNRVGLGPTAIADPFKALQHEKRVEMAFEPHRWFDITRWGLGSAIFGSRWNDKFKVFPFPQSEIDRSAGLLKQNPGY